MNKKRLIILLISIVGVICILVGTVAYYRITVDGSIKVFTDNALFDVTKSYNESIKKIILKEGKLIPGDKGSFTLSLDATKSDIDMYVTLSIDRNNLPTNLKFYTTSDYKSELHKYYEFMDSSNKTKDITIYWYWNPYIDSEEDSNFIKNNNVKATIKLNAVQISEYAIMKNGSNITFDEKYKPIFNGTEFWNDIYRNYIRKIIFINDLSILPEVCNEENLCFDVTETESSKKVYAYLVDSEMQGLVGQKNYGDEKKYENLYNLYIVSDAPIFAPVDCSYMFYSFINLVTIEFNNNFNTSLTTDMEGMFMTGGYYYTDDKSSSITSTAHFEVQTNLKELDLSSFNTSNVTNMQNIFRDCRILQKLDISNFDTSKVTNMKIMFNNCRILISLDLSSFNTTNVTDMSAMFQSCSVLKELDLSSFDTSNVTDMNSMFGGCSSLINLDLSSFNTSNVTDMSYMFQNCSSLIATINIMNASANSYSNMFSSTATAEGSMVTVNYIADASDLVDSMIATKSSTSNVVKGIEI